MTDVQTIKQNLTGKAQQVIGAVEKKMGHPVKGTITQIKGNANVAISEAKSNIQNSK